MTKTQIEKNKSLTEVGEQKANTTAGFNESLGPYKKIGLTLFLLVFVFFGGWAALAPIDGAAVATGAVTVRSYSKFVQHLEGGIIENIFVDNGTEVEKGQPILVLDSTQSQTQLDIANSQFIYLKALESRLLAESDNQESINYPADFPSLGDTATEESLAQEEIFSARKAMIEGRIGVLEQRIEQLESQGIGLEALRASKEQLAASYSDELQDVIALLNQGFSEKTRLRELERNVANFNGEAADLSANIAVTQMSIGETRLEILQIQTEFLNEVVTELGEVQTNMTDVSERITALTDIVSRTIIRAPESGIVNGLQVHTIGGVITPGMQIVEIVPQKDDLIIEAKVSPMDIDRVAINQEATIRFSSFGNASVPTIYGQLINLSANSVFDQVTGTTHYLARVEVTPGGMEDLGDLDLMPGMPAEVFISTGDRTMLEYLFKPFSNAMARSFRED
ncbi:MAG: HlyD family type I secretion periplasmic adaptor subunit [Gammaproteobacteria bacterium]|nr:HlyD family type I secretion periplasmic adaptor subunit [Gammaproteobacteria bacterium]